MARASRELAITHGAQFAAQRLLGDDDTEFLENPLAEIDDPPAHDPVNRRDWAALDDRGERGAMRAVQPRRLPWRLAVDQAVRALRVELDHPVANDLQPDAPDLRRLSARGAVVNRRKSQQSARLRPVLRPFRRRPQPTRAINHPEDQLLPPRRTSCDSPRSNKFQPIRQSPSVSLHQRGLVLEANARREIQPAGKREQPLRAGTGPSVATPV